MKSLDNLKIQHKCSECKLHTAKFFCDFPRACLETFESLKITSAYSKGSSVFIQGQPSNGIYMLCQGRVKLCTYSKDGKAIILRIALAGEVLGLSATLSDSVHEATAEVLEPSQINFVRKQDVLRFLRQNPDAGINALRQLSHNYHAAHTQICSLGLSASVGDKLAKLLLGWCSTSIGNGSNGSIHLKVSFSHEEIAEMIGSSRETVTRLLKDFRDRELIIMNGSDLYIHDTKKLEDSIGTRPFPHPEM
jgi:CRP/FNR family cyclic AMP-dependent transcriptional regulator